MLLSPPRVRWIDLLKQRARMTGEPLPRAWPGLRPWSLRCEPLQTNERPCEVAQCDVT